MSSSVDQFDSWLAFNAPAALVIREYLTPVDGPDGVLFPPTFAAAPGDGFPGGYNIDPIDGQQGSRNVCLIDSVGSQANRVEPIFAEAEYRHLVPQVIIRAGEKEINILDAGHRAGDALVRCSQLQDTIQSAFHDVLRGNAEPLAKIAPTSLVFGVWDSRDTQAKLPRLVSSTIRAFDVRKMTRGAVYIPPVDYSALQVFSEAEKAKAEGQGKSPLAQRGFVHNPASAAHGGVIADGGVRRDASLSLAALQSIKAGNDAERTLTLRRYILGLALVAFTARPATYLRQGCQLVRDTEKESRFEVVHGDGLRTPADLSHQDALAFATAAAASFGVGEDRTVDFDKKKATNDVKKKD